MTLPAVTAFNTLRSDIISLRTELRRELGGEIGSVQTGLRGDIASLRTEMHDEFASLGTAIRSSHLEWYDLYMAAGVAAEAGAGTLSLSGEARAWVESLPAGTWFRTTAVPGPRHVVRNVLSRLLSAQQPIIGRVARSIYWRQPPAAAHRYGSVPVLNKDADSVLGPAGSSYAGFCALSHIGWSTQIPYRTTLAVPYRNLRPPKMPFGPPVLFEERPNLRRRSLNWNEANLLEAARAAAAADYCHWDHAMWCLTEANGWMKHGEPIRKEQLLWAAEGESPGNKWPYGGEGVRALEAVIARLADDLPSLLPAP